MTPQIQLSSLELKYHLILFLTLITTTQSIYCSYNIKCSSSCLMRMCQYDSDTNQYFFQKCCKGCVDQYFWDQSSKKCTQNSCSTFFARTKTYWWFRNNTCLQKCPVQYYFQQKYELNPWVASDVTGRCMKVCPPGYYSYGIGNQSRICVQECPDGLYKQEYNGSRFCTDNCSKNGQYYLKIDTKECTTCTNLTGYYRYVDTYYYSNHSCVTVCPQNYTRINYIYGDRYCTLKSGNQLCGEPYIFDKQTNSCVFCQHYNSQYTLLSINNSQQCSRYCPVNYYLHPKTNKCYYDCSYLDLNQLYYRDDLQMICADIGECSFDQQNNVQTFGNNQTKSCVYECPNFSYGHPQLKICVKKCFGQYPKQNIETKLCEKQQIYISTGDNIQLTKTMVIIGGVGFGAFAIIVVVIAFGIDKCCCKKQNKFQNIQTQTPPNDQLGDNKNEQQDDDKSIYSSQFLKQLQIPTQNSLKDKGPRRTPSFL